MKKCEIQIILVGGTLAERSLIAGELCSLMTYDKWGSGEIESIDGQKVDLDLDEYSDEFFTTAGALRGNVRRESDS